MNAASGGRLAVIAALPREVAALVRGATPHRQAAPGVFLWSTPRAVIAAAGMGSERVTLAVEAALALGPVHTIMSVGLAGACSAAAAVGSLLEVTEVVDVRTGERFSTAAGSRRITQAGASRERNVVLVTAPAIASAREKARLHASYGADAVDMEAATVARLAEAHGIPFRALKAISDDHTFELEHLGRFATKHGHFHTRAFALHTAVRPHLWRGTMRLGRHSAHALKVLTTALEAEIANAVTE